MLNTSQLTLFQLSRMDLEINYNSLPSDFAMNDDFFVVKHCCGDYLDPCNFQLDQKSHICMKTSIFASQLYLPEYKENRENSRDHGDDPTLSTHFYLLAIPCKKVNKSQMQRMLHFLAVGNYSRLYHYCVNVICQ